jgi:hypothetical protein
LQGKPIVKLQVVLHANCSAVSLDNGIYERFMPSREQAITGLESPLDGCAKTPRFWFDCQSRQLLNEETHSPDGHLRVEQHREPTYIKRLGQDSKE